MKSEKPPFKVDFIGIGAPRCGTTWIFRCLEKHPEIASSYVKEVGFFSDDTEYAKGLAGYEQYFRDQQPGTRVGEFTPMYISDSRVASRIKQLAPDVKLIASFRNPIEALYSLYHFRQARGKHNYGSFEDFLEREPDEIENWKYMKQLSPYVEAFPRENILVMIFEDISADPRKFMQTIYQFIDVDPTFKSEFVEQRVNVGNQDTVLFLSRLMWKAMNLLSRTRAGNRLVHGLFQSRMRSKTDQLFERNRKKRESSNSRPPMLDGTRAHLQSLFHDDIAELERFLDRDLKVWH